MAVSTRLLSLSRLMAWLSLAGFVLVPAITAYVFLRPDTSQWLMFNVDHLGATLNGKVPLNFRLMALACELVAVAFTMWSLWSLRRLFLLYAQGEVFSYGAFRALNHVAIALFGGVIANFVMQGPISFLLSYPLGPGHRYISLGFGSGDVATLFMAGVVLVIARVMIPALLASYVISVIFQEGAFRGFASLGEFNTFVARISLASFLAYVFGQILDIQVFDRLRRMRQWWIAPVVSTLFGNLLDTFAFFSIAFWHSDNAFMAEHWVEIAWVDYGVKLAVMLMLFVPLYGMLLSAITRNLRRQPATA